MILRSSTSAVSSISEQIEAARTRLVTLAGLLVAAGYLVTAGWKIATGENHNWTFLGLIIAGGIFGLVAAGLGLLDRREAASLVLAADLTIVTTLLALNFATAFEIALAAYVGVLLVTLIGTSKTEVLVATLVVMPLAGFSYINQPGSEATLPGLFAISGLLIAAGVTLSWLQDNLLQAIGQLEDSRAHLHRLSHQDPLTGLGNRRLFDERVARQLSYSSADRPLALVVIDVDKLKMINDKHGHPAGDMALHAVAEAIRASTRDSDIAARIGGDEFGIVLSSGGIVGAENVAERVHQHLQEWSANELNLTVSIGVAESDTPDFGVEALLDVADRDLYSGRVHDRVHLVDALVRADSP